MFSDMHTSKCKVLMPMAKRKWSYLQPTRPKLLAVVLMATAALLCLTTVSCHIQHMVSQTVQDKQQRETTSSRSQSTNYMPSKQRQDNKKPTSPLLSNVHDSSVNTFVESFKPAIDPLRGTKSTQNLFNRYVENSVTSNQTNHGFQCPEQFGYFADLTDCSRYFVCVFGDPLHETCTGGLYFSSELQTCDWPQNVVCDLDIGKEEHQRVEQEQMSFPKQSPSNKNITSDNTFTEPLMDNYGVNDLNSPQFDESIASFIDHNGDVYVHDGPGGLYSMMERTAAISDHDKSIMQTNQGYDGKFARNLEASSTQTILSPQNSNSEKPRESITNEYRPKKESSKKVLLFSPKEVIKCGESNGNCTSGTQPNQSVQFDDDINNEDNYDDKLEQSLPEHLRPRTNIVKKQLKDYEMELFNKVEDELSTENVNLQKDQPMKPTIITFVADKKDLWNTKKNIATKVSEIVPPEPLVIGYNNRRGENIPPFSASNIAEDSIMQVFRGRTSLVSNEASEEHNISSRPRNYLLRSFNTLPLSFPTNLMKPWQTTVAVNGRTTNQVNNQNRNSKDHKFSTTLEWQQQQQNTGNKIQVISSQSNNKTTKSSPSDTEIYIFYSYRNGQHDKLTDNGSSKRQHISLLPVPAQTPNMSNNTTTAYETAVKDRPIVDVPKSNVFTIRSNDLLVSKNISTGITSSSTGSSWTTPKSLPIVLEYNRYGKQQQSATVNTSNSSNVRNGKTNTLTVLPANNLQYNNYSYFDKFEPTKTVPVMSVTTPKPSNSQNNITATTSHILHQYSAANEPIPLKVSSKIPSQCDQSLNCKLPKCFCPGITTPLGLKREDTPQMVLLTFDDAVNDVNFPIYEELFESLTKISSRKRKRSNPNGCPIRGTFFVAHEWTDYGKVQTLFARGHEIASHSITHRFGEKFSTSEWRREIAGQREILHRYAGIPRSDIRGMRAPFLQPGGDQQFQMLIDSNFSYDSSIAIFDNAPPFWPYTLDFALQHDCMITPCPTRSYPGLWEIGLIMWHDLVGGGRCTMGNSCTSPVDEQGVFELIMSNFKRHYHTNRAPFGLFYQSGWFATAHHKAGFLRFVDEVLQLGDVYFVTNWQLLQWMQQPTRLSELYHFAPWQCKQHKQSSNNVSECVLSNICQVKFHEKNGKSSGTRYFKTCQPCPNDYPWIDNIDDLLNAN